MENKLSISDCINSTYEQLNRNSDFSDDRTTSQFMILLDSLIHNPKELSFLSNQDLSNLGVCMSSIMSSGFTQRHPIYKIWDIGKVIGAIGFYAFMKQLDNSYLRNSHFPAFIVLIKTGREYIADLFQYSILLSASFNRNNPFDRIDFYDSEQKKHDIIKHFEYTLHTACIQNGYSDETLTAWYNEIEDEIDLIEQRLQTKSTIQFAKSMYHSFVECFSKGEMPKYCKEN